MYSGNMIFSDFIFSPDPYLLKAQSTLEDGVFLTNVSGEGEFEGENAFSKYKRLKEIFSAGETAWLRMPMIKPLKAKLVELTLTEDARENMIGYSFRFQEVKEEYSSKNEMSFISVGEQKSVWDIEKDYAADAERILELNESISDCYDVHSGERIRIS